MSKVGSRDRHTRWRSKNSTKRRKKPLTGGASQHKAEVPQKKNPKHSGLEYSDVDI